MPYLFDAPNGSLAERLFPWLADVQDPSSRRMRDFLAPPGYSADELRMWIEAICTMFETNPSNLAKMAGSPPSTLNKFMSSAAEGRNLTASTINDIIKGITDGKLGNHIKPPADIIIGNVFYNIQPVLFAESFSDSIWRDLRLVRKRPKEIRAPIPVEFSDLPIIAFGVASNQNEGIISSGSMLLCIPVSRSDLFLPHVGDRYLLLSLNEAEQTYQISVRELAQDPLQRRWLLPVGAIANTLPATPLLQDSQIVALDGIETKAAFKVISYLQPDRLVTQQASF